MNHTRTWSDMYGSACAVFEGRAGGHTWLVATPSELAQGVPAALEALDGKGMVELIVHDGLTPLLNAIHEVKPRGVVVVAPKAAKFGPAVKVEARTVSDAGGVEYNEGGEFPEWVGANTDGKKGRGKGEECAAASAVSSLDLPVVVAAPDGVQAALEEWMSNTPHGR